MSLVDLFDAGGPVMWPLAACSLLALTIVLERLFVLRHSRVLQPTIVERVTGLAEGGRADRALEVCRENPGIFTHIIASGLEHAAVGDRETVAREAIEAAGRQETARLSRFLGTLGTVVGISPLLGLLGTVLGMIEVFQTISQSGAGQAEQLSGGISQALISTATGLCIAIPSLVGYNFLTERSELIVARLESDSLRVLRAFYRGTGADRAPLAPPARDPAERTAPAVTT